MILTEVAQQVCNYMQENVMQLRSIDAKATFLTFVLSRKTKEVAMGNLANDVADTLGLNRKEVAKALGEEDVKNAVSPLYIWKNLKHGVLWLFTENNLHDIEGNNWIFVDPSNNEEYEISKEKLCLLFSVPSNS